MPDTRLAEINQVAAGETVRWRPISPALMARLLETCQRAARPAGGQSRWRPAIALSLRVLFPFGPRQQLHVL